MNKRKTRSEWMDLLLNSNQEILDEWGKSIDRWSRLAKLSLIEGVLCGFLLGISFSLLISVISCIEFNLY
jgi:hypothetical protein